MGDKFQYETGAVTFLDVLGWKGIWHQDPDAAKKLWNIVKETRNKAEEISKEYADKFEELRGKKFGKIVKIVSISDTIALFSKGDANLSVEIQAKICAWLLEHALSHRIPLRGAISYGKYIEYDNIMQGPAVDEAASWYEFVDWIGVVLTPSAQMKIDVETINFIARDIPIPYKQAGHKLTTCVDWTFGDAGKLEEIMLSKMPLTPEIAPKYLNTLAFLKRNKTTSST